MTDITYSIQQFDHNNTGVIMVKLPQNILDAVTQEINTVSENRSTASKRNSTLIGQLEDEYDLESSKVPLFPFLEQLAQQYERAFPGYIKQKTSVLNLEKDYHLSLDSLWVNFQKKGEYNPPHDHSGLYSFVIWIKVPYNIDDELNLPNARNSNRPANGMFNFFYTTAHGNITLVDIKADRSYEGTLVLFPSTMWHSVNPFYTSDEERISVSGNLYLKANEE